MDGKHFVENWLWLSETRLTAGREWSPAHVADAAQMVEAAAAAERSRIVAVLEAKKREWMLGGPAMDWAIREIQRGEP